VCIFTKIDDPERLDPVTEVWLVLIRDSKHFEKLPFPINLPFTGCDQWMISEMSIQQPGESL
jgi:hypothetical protein